MIRITTIGIALLSLFAGLILWVQGTFALAQSQQRSMVPMPFTQVPNVISTATSTETPTMVSFQSNQTPSLPQALTIVTHQEFKHWITLGDHEVRADTVDIRLTQFPKPDQDNGRGLHWFPTAGQKREVVDRYVPELVQMKIRWLVILQGLDDWDLTANDYLVTRLNEQGIISIMRIETKVGTLDLERLDATVAHYRALGVRYFQIFNEPNVPGEWNDSLSMTPENFMEYWIPAAEVVAREGGMPGLAPLVQQSNYTDEIFFDDELRYLLNAQRYDLINVLWLSLHNYGGMDQNGFLRYHTYANLAHSIFGQYLPMISTEGGMGDAPTSNLSVLAVFKAMATREPWYLAYCPWLIGNEVGGGHDDTWESQAWFQRNGPMPIVQNIKNLP